MAMDTEKLKQLSDIEGVSEQELLEQAVIGDDCKGICINPECSYTTKIEPDQDAGYCEVCSTNTVQSCLVLSGLM
jgi:hypothetical protein